MGILGRKIEIGPDTILQRNKDIIFNKVDEEIVMLSIENGEYYGLRKVGSRIWILLENPISVKDLINQLILEYYISEKKCESDTIDFLEKLHEKAIIDLH